MDVSDGKCAVVPGREACCSCVGNAYPPLPQPPGSSPAVAVAAGASVATRVVLLGWVGWDGMGTLALPRRNGSVGRTAQGPVVSSSAAVLQGLALAHFYLLEEARAMEPALSLGAHSSGTLLEQEDRTSLALVGQRHHCRELHAISGMEEPQKRLFSSSLSTAVHAEEQTVIREETGSGLS